MNICLYMFRCSTQRRRSVSKFLPLLYFSDILKSNWFRENTKVIPLLKTCYIRCYDCTRISPFSRWANSSLRTKPSVKSFLKFQIHFNSLFLISKKVTRRQLFDVSHFCQQTLNIFMHIDICICLFRF